MKVYFECNFNFKNWEKPFSEITFSGDFFLSLFHSFNIKSDKIIICINPTINFTISGRELFSRPTFVCF